MNISSLDDVGRLHRLAGVSARDVGWDESHFGIDVGPLRGTFIPSKPVNPFDLMIGDLGFLYHISKLELDGLDLDVRQRSKTCFHFRRLLS